MNKVKIKKGDPVIVITGKDKKKKGKVLRVFRDERRVLVEGINKVKKHQKPRRGGEQGQIIEKSLPIDISNVMLIDPKTNRRTRVGKKIVDGKSKRVAKKSGTILG